MINKIIRTLSDLIRRFENGTKIGTVCEIDLDNARVKVQIGNIKTTWLPWVVNRAGNNGEWNPLEIGEQVVVLSPSGKTEQGIVLGAINSKHYPMRENAPNIHAVWYKDDAVISYDRLNHLYRISLPSGAKMTINSDGGLKVNGNITVKGDVIADGISLKNHVHTGVTSGTSTTGVPV